MSPPQDVNMSALEFQPDSTGPYLLQKPGDPLRAFISPSGADLRPPVYLSELSLPTALVATITSSGAVPCSLSLITVKSSFLAFLR